MQAAVRSGAGDELIGTWRLVSFELRNPDGTVSYPFGKDVTGYLFYNDQGFMSAAFMGADRARPDSEMVHCGKDVALGGPTPCAELREEHLGPCRRQEAPARFEPVSTLGCSL